jgi:hypothetical protein
MSRAAGWQGWHYPRDCELIFLIFITINGAVGMLFADHKESSSQDREMTENLTEKWRSLMYLDLREKRSIFPLNILYHPRETLMTPAILLV